MYIVVIRIIEITIPDRLQRFQLMSALLNILWLLLFAYIYFSFENYVLCHPKPVESYAIQKIHSYKSITHTHTYCLAIGSNV